MLPKPPKITTGALSRVGPASSGALTYRWTQRYPARMATTCSSGSNDSSRTTSSAAAATSVRSCQTMSMFRLRIVGYSWGTTRSGPTSSAWSGSSGSSPSTSHKLEETISSRTGENSPREYSARTSPTGASKARARAVATHVAATGEALAQ
jgi:hypothetical protein